MDNKEPIKSKWATARLILGIISIVLFPIISFQSCAAGLGNALSDNGEISGFAGFFTAILLLVSGIVMIATRNNIKKAASITCCIFCWACFFFSRMFSGSYADLRIWGMIAFFFGAFYLITSMHSKKGVIISIVVSVIYFVLGIL